MRNIIHWFMYIGLALSILYIGFITYQSIYAKPPIQYTQPFKVEQPIYQRGDEVRYDVTFCLTKPEVDFDYIAKIVNQGTKKETFLAGGFATHNTDGADETGCKTVRSFPIIIPESVQNGKFMFVYTLHIDGKFKTHIINLRSTEFEVVE